jgi:anti-sigma factor RsiW
MNCNDAAPFLAAYADGEVGAPQRDAVAEHLRGCADCAARHEAVLRLRDRLRAEATRYAAPPLLRSRVLAIAESDVPPERSRTAARTRGRWLALGALAGSAATIVAWLAATAILDWRAAEDLGVEAVNAHVRATLGGHRVEIASSDQHAVKPWLSARLDYSPPVRDLAADGFALAGARLDYLDRRPVATLVYRYREHTIDVFVRPPSPRVPPLASKTVRGFNVASATGQGMEWLGVSDTNPGVLGSLVERLARDASPK